MNNPTDSQYGDAVLQKRGCKNLCLPASRLCILLAAALALVAPLSARVPRQPAFPPLPAPATTGQTTGDPSLKRLLFGLGVGFERFAGAQGVAITRVLPDSPAARAGLVAGCMVTEINGIVTTGRSGEDCARIIQSAFGPIRVKFLDTNQQEKTLKLRKAWLQMPEYRVFSP